MTRQIIVVDVETTGLDPEEHSAIEVAWRNLYTGESGLFVPEHDPEYIEGMARRDREVMKALEINGYFERLMYRPQDRSGEATRRLNYVLSGNVLAGSNPAFDARFLENEFREQRPELVGKVWHHRMLDLSAYAAGVLGLDLAELPGLSTVCELVGVFNRAPHTAAGDVQATVECFRRLAARKAAVAS